MTQIATASNERKDGERPPAASFDRRPDPSPAFQLLEVLERAGSTCSTRQLAYVFVNSFCNQIRCEQVILGRVSNGTVRPIAVSGMSQIRLNNPGVRAATQAMEECLDFKSIITFPCQTSSQPAFRIHRQWAKSSGDSQVVSIPVMTQGEVVAVVSFRRSNSEMLSDSQTQRLGNSLGSLGTILGLIERAEQPVYRRLYSMTHLAVQRRRTWVRAVVALVVLAGVGWSVFGKMTFRPLCNSKIVASQMQHIAVPFEAMLEHVYVHAGDRVHKGDVIVQFETRQLSLELKSIQAEIARTDVNARAAIDENDAATAALHQAHIKVLLAKSRSLEYRIDSARILAPADGMIVHSDVENRVGQVFSQGEPIVQFAPDGGWSLHVHVPDSIASHVEPQHQGCFISAARPSEKIEFQIEHVNGAAEVIDEENVFVAKAKLTDSKPWMRTGMEGIARIETRPMPPWWIAFHKVVDWARLRFWI